MKPGERLVTVVSPVDRLAGANIYVAVDDNAVQCYLRVFREVFERTGHRAHYRMMMRIIDD